MLIVYYTHFIVCSVSSVAQSCPTLCNPWIAAHQGSLSITNSQSLLKLVSIELVMPYNCLILCHPLLLLPSIFPSIRDFSNEPFVCTGWPKYWSFSFSISPSSEYSGLISLKIDWFDLLAVQGTLKSLLQHHSSKARPPQKFWIWGRVPLKQTYAISIILCHWIHMPPFSRKG